MELKEYQELALRSELKADALSFNKEYITKLLKLFITTSSILDGLKAEIFYKKSTKADENTLDNLQKIESLSKELQFMFIRDRKNKEEISLSPRVFHGMIGLATESAELLEIAVKNLEHNTPIDTVNVGEEIVDGNWFSAIIMDELNLNWEDYLERNINKLRVRFPDKFTVDNANNRDLAAERLVLEDNFVK